MMRDEELKIKLTRDLDTLCDSLDYAIFKMLRNGVPDAESSKPGARLYFTDEMRLLVVNYASQLVADIWSHLSISRVWTSAAMSLMESLKSLKGDA